MSSPATAYPGGAADIASTPTGWPSGGNGAAWSNYANLVGNSGGATCSLTNTHSPSDVLLAYNFGMGSLIPGGSTVVGVEASVSRNASVTGRAEDLAVYLTTDSSGDILSGTSNQAESGMYVLSPGFTFNYGGASSFWGLGSIALSTVTASGFGFGFQTTTAGGNVMVTVQPAYLSIYYTAPASTASPAALLCRSPFVLLAGAWLPFTAALARELAGQVCLFKQTRHPGRVVSVPCRPARLVLPKLVLPKRFQVDRPARVLAQ